MGKFIKKSENNLFGGNTDFNYYNIGCDIE